MEVKEFDTIAAIATPPGEGAIGIVRVSGDQAIQLVDQIYQGKISLQEVPSHTIHYGLLIDPKTQQQYDEVLVSVMRAPKTFTREDVVEINCHGGFFVTQQVLQLILRQGARLAEPGEFTKRAFLHGRIDLSQAEAIMDLIRSKTDQAQQLAIQQLEGRLSHKINELRQMILNVLAQVEVSIDYPEYEDVEEMTVKHIKEHATQVKEALDFLLKTAHQGQLLREGIDLVILGRPNVGKSSLLNYLLQEEKAIVTDIAGTTRDVIEASANISGIPVHIMDTAGIRETEDIVEKIGVDRSKQALQQADLVLLLFNQNEPFTAEDQDLLKETEPYPRIIVFNKSDLKRHEDIDKVLETLQDQTPYLFISVKDDQGLEQLENRIYQKILHGETFEKEATYVSNARHIALLEQARSAIEEVLSGLALEVPIDLLQIDLTRSWEILGEITGDTVPDALITELFTQFCLGK